MITPIADKLAQEIEQMPLLSSVIPYEFGGSQIDQIEVSCGSCSAILGPDTIRGTIEVVAGGKAAKLFSYGICYKCKTVTPVESIFHDDGVVLIKVDQGWVKDVWTTRKRGILDDVLKIVRHRWQQVFPPVIAIIVAIGWILERGN